MQITLNHDEIMDAVTQYVANQGIAITGKKIDVTMTAGRGSNGYTANVDLLQEDSVQTPPDSISDSDLDNTVNADGDEPPFEEEENNDKPNKTDSLFGE